MRRTMAFSGSDLDRAAHLRSDPPAPQSVLALWQGLVPVRDGCLAWLPAQEVPAGTSDVFLGMGADGPLHARQMASEPAGLDFVGLRDVMARLPTRDAELAATARAILNWHDSHRFCSACGHASDTTQGGWQRLCPACGTSHFPRTDPVVIMLVLHEDRLLLGRSPLWRAGLHSCLAGFIEPGETVEAAVRREVQEETGVRVGPVRYLTSQPWPFPASLMLGCVGIAETTALTLDPVEIEAARWADRAEVMEALIGRHPDIELPQTGSIAHDLITRWLADDLD